MSKNRNRSRLNKSTIGREYNILLINDLYPIYWDEGILMYPQTRFGFKNPNKRLMKFEIRMYRSWKHNRKTQWRVA
jgi:hypothetical protein